MKEDPTTTTKKSTNGKRKYCFIIAMTLLGGLVVLAIAVVLPILWIEAPKEVALYTSWLLFLVLLVASIILLLSSSPPESSQTPPHHPDYRVVHFKIRVALALGIGATIVAVLLVIAVWGLASWAQFPS